LLALDEYCGSIGHGQGDRPPTVTAPADRDLDDLIDGGGSRVGELSEGAGWDKAERNVFAQVPVLTN
jgi:hypothetical protein